MVMFQPGFQREREERLRYKGRGKYKRKYQQYFIDFYSWDNKHMTGGLAFGYKNMREEKRRLRPHGVRYRVKITKGVKK